MNVEKHIISLLYKYDCVIIPGFGGFIAQSKSAVFHPLNYTFTPPKKIVGFNSDLVHSDGLLANEIVRKNKVSYEKAISAINEMVNSWNFTLKNGKILEIDSLGTFKLVNNNLDFTPNEGLNFSFDSFGMYPVKGNYIIRDSSEKDDIQEPTTPWMSYVAAIAFAIIIGASSFIANDNIIQPQLSSFLPLLNQNSNTEINNAKIDRIAPVLKVTSKELENSTPLIQADNVENPIEAENSTKENEEDLSIKRYRVIGGSFKLYSKAMEHRVYLKRKGFDHAVIIGRVGNFYMVAYDTFDDHAEAIEYKRTLEKKGLDVFMIP